MKVKRHNFQLVILLHVARESLEHWKEIIALALKKKKKLLNKQDCYISFYEGSRLMIDIPKKVKVVVNSESGSH